MANEKSLKILIVDDDKNICDLLRLYLEKDGYIIAEWSENIEDFLPDDAIFVSISRTENSDDERLITIIESKEKK